jgi:hypothetical protein
MDTQSLIDRLAADPTQVRRLPAPSARVLTWFALSVPYLALVIVLMTPRGDLVVKLAEGQFMLDLSAALVTGVAAAAAAFLSTIPGIDRRLLLVPIVPLLLWLGSIGYGCVDEWIRFGADGVPLEQSWACFRRTLLATAVPALIIAVMLRRGAPVMPVTTAALGALAAAGLGHVGVRLFHPQDSSMTILVWQMGTVFLLIVFAGAAGRYLLNWKTRIDNSFRQAASPAGRRSEI